ncbi:MAG: hypothetical protein IJR20_06335 [Muribaculaceae bacterium]|nr:hypothetical protein [Muribaculaceae bacterium]
MNKFLLSLALVATALTFASCTDDEPNKEQPVKETIQGKDLINWTIKAADNTTNYVETADYTFNIERTKNEATVSVLAQGVQFDSHMPFKVSFRMEDIKASSFDDNFVRFKAESVKFFDPETGEENAKYKLTNVRGYVDKKNNVYSLDYTVNGTWRVLVCNSTVSSLVTDNNYNATSELYYTYKIDVANRKAEVFIYNVQFQVGGATSPVLKKISIPNLDVEFTTLNYTELTDVDDITIITDPIIKLTGDNIVPIYYTGENLDQATPYPALSVTNFNSALCINQGFYTIYFNARGGEHNSANNPNCNLYLWNEGPASNPIH